MFTFSKMCFIIIEASIGVLILVASNSSDMI